MIINLADFNTAYKNVCSTTSTKDSRPILKAIHVIYDGGNTLLMESTDSFTLTRVILNVKYQNGDEPFDMIFMPEKLTGLKTELVSIKLENRCLVICDTNKKKVFLQELEDEREYPRFNNIIPSVNDNAVKIAFTVKNLKAILNGLSSDDMIVMFINDSLKPVIIKSDELYKLDKTSFKLLSPCRLNNSTYMQDINSHIIDEIKVSNKKTINKEEPKEETTEEIKEDVIEEQPKEEIKEDVEENAITYTNADSNSEIDFDMF